MRTFLLAALVSVGVCAAEVSVVRVPKGGIKASAAVDAAGALHLVYFSGDPKAGDAFYVTSRDGGAAFAAPIRVNSQPRSVLGASSARGPHLALGRDGRVHVLWAGSSLAQPRGPLNPAQPADSPHNGTPLLYARLDGAAFTPQRNLMTRTIALDGDSTLTADAVGNVFAVWHAMPLEGKGESDRAVWLAASSDDGGTFAPERNVLPQPTGACACCGLTAHSGNGALSILYRVAPDGLHRGMSLLTSTDRGATFSAQPLDEWKVATCPMSTGAILAAADRHALLAWENDKQIFYARPPDSPVAVPGFSGPRKHPALAVNSRGETLIAWTEGIGFGKGGSVAWQQFDAKGQPVGEPGRADKLPAHGNVAAAALSDGRFVVIY
jgi:hypothetical protein